MRYTWQGMIELRTFGDTPGDVLFLGTQIPLVAVINRLAGQWGRNRVRFTAEIEGCTQKVAEGQLVVDSTVRAGGGVDRWASWWDQQLQVGDKDVLALLVAAVGRQARIKMDFRLAAGMSHRR